MISALSPTLVVPHRQLPAHKPRVVALGQTSTGMSELPGTPVAFGSGLKKVLLPLVVAAGLISGCGPSANEKEASTFTAKLSKIDEKDSEKRLALIDYALERDNPNLQIAALQELAVLKTDSNKKIPLALKALAAKTNNQNETEQDRTIIANAKKVIAAVAGQSDVSPQLKTKLLQLMMYYPEAADKKRPAVPKEYNDLSEYIQAELQVKTSK